MATTCPPLNGKKAKTPHGKNLAGEKPAKKRERSLPRNDLKKRSDYTRPLV